MRMTGKTTRLIDQTIQQLFEGKRLLFPIHKDKVDKPRIGALSLYDEDFEKRENFKIILDEDWAEGQAQENMFGRFLDRLESEHGLYLNKKHDHYYGHYVSLKDFKKQN